MSADFDFLHLPEIDSTNSEARRQAEAGADAPLWIIADSQTAGRGRRGRQWQSPVGNLMTTLLLPGAAAPASSVQAGQLAFVAGLALHATIAHYLAGQEIEVSLKWPNDVLVEGSQNIRHFAGDRLDRAGQAGLAGYWAGVESGASPERHALSGDQSGRAFEPSAG